MYTVSMYVSLSLSLPPGLGGVRSPPATLSLSLLSPSKTSGRPRLRDERMVPKPMARIMEALLGPA